MYIPWQTVSNKWIGTIIKYWVLLKKKESENDVVWIILQSRNFEKEKETIPKVEGDVTYLISIFYADPNYREKVFKMDILQEEEKTTTYIPIFVMMPAILGPIFVMRKNWAKDCRHHDKNWYICCCFFLVLQNVHFKKFSI